MVGYLCFMKSIELRIGNLINYPNWNKDGTAALFRIRDIYTDNDKIGLTNGVIQLPSTKLDYINPIPLTEEWLLKFGFHYTNDEWIVLFWVNGRVIFTIEYTGKIFIEEKTRVHLKYVHQLQNLYFALTEDELSI